MASKAICLLLFAGFGFTCSAQSIRQQMTTRQPECRDILMNAASTMPKLYDTRQFDSLRVAINVMKEYCNPSTPEVLYAGILIDIQQYSFDIHTLDTAGRLYTLLENYPATLKYLKAGGYSVNRYNYYSYASYEENYYALIRRWASDLLNTKGLNDEEAFICNILAGNIKRPEPALKAQKEKYPNLYAMLRSNYSTERTGLRGLSAFTAGTWIPSGNNTVLGTHPTLGIQAGIRGTNDEVDFTLNFKFGKTPRYYAVLRSDSLYSFNHFFGGYIGLDYAHYFYHSTSFEAGLMGGAGYDGFDINDEDNSDHHLDYLKPLGIGSLNLNAGFRMNYFFSPRLFLGVITRYNYLNYKNKGGTDMSGNTFSIDIAIGGTWRK